MPPASFRARMTRRMPRFSAAPEGDSADGASMPIRISLGAAWAVEIASVKASGRRMVRMVAILPEPRRQSSRTLADGFQGQRDLDQCPLADFAVERHAPA